MVVSIGFAVFNIFHCVNKDEVVQNLIHFLSCHCEYGGLQLFPIVYAESKERKELRKVGWPKHDTFSQGLSSGQLYWLITNSNHWKFISTANWSILYVHQSLYFLPKFNYLWVLVFQIQKGGKSKGNPDYIWRPNSIQTFQLHADVLTPCSQMLLVNVIS